MINDNKRSFFEIEIALKEEVNYDNGFLKRVTEDVENQIDAVLHTMSAQGIIIVKNSKDRSEINYLFETGSRKRIGLLRNSLTKKAGNVYGVEDIDCKSYIKREFKEQIQKYLEDKELIVKRESSAEYKGKDLRIFNDKKNWYSWQKDLYNKLFDSNGKMKSANEREIILYRCLGGKSGKSTFLKYLYYNHIENIGLLDEGSSGQIKSGIVNNGPKKCYFIDLPRTRGRDEDMSGLLQAVEQAKNGICTKNFFGSGSSLLMEVPWIIITANYIPLGGFSEDRWKVLDLHKKGNDVIFKDVSRKMRKIARDKILVDKYEIDRREREIVRKANLIRNKLKKPEAELKV